MAARDVAAAIRRLESLENRKKLLNGELDILDGIRLNEEERQLLLEDCEQVKRLGSGDLSQPCMDPELNPSGSRGLFFNSARYAMDGMKRELAEFREFLVRAADGR